MQRCWGPAMDATANAERTSRASGVSRPSSALVPLLAAASQKATSDDVPTILGAPPKPPPTPLELPYDLLTGDRLAHFEIVGPLGIGGMATVVLARDTSLGRDVALKILPPELAKEAEAVARFKNEARSAAKLDHESIARVYYTGEERGLNFIAFEFVEGETLRERIDRLGTLPWADSLPLMADAARGLQHASERGVVHRDVKPSNLVIGPSGRAKLIDMGLARSLDPTATHASVTQTGTTLGTFDYISPEQAIDPRSADVRSDLYSLGCTFYHALTGRSPVPDGNAARKLHAQQTEQPTDPRLLNPALPDKLVELLERLMAKAPADRFQSPGEFLAAIERTAVALKVEGGSNGSVGSISSAPRAAEPKPSGWGFTAIALGIGALVAAFAVAAGWLSRGESTAPFVPWDGSLRPIRTEPAIDQGLPPPRNAPTPVRERAVSNAVELQKAIADGVTKIVLTGGTTFDLTSTEGVVVTAKIAEWESSDGKPATVRIAAGKPNDDRPGDLRKGSLTFHRCESVKLTGLRFEVVPGPAERNETAVGLLGVDLGRLDASECRFEAESAFPSTETAALGIVQRGPATTTVGLKSLMFVAKNATGLELAGSIQASASDCGFLASRTAIRFGPSTEKSNLALRSCSIQLASSSASAVAVAAGGKANVQAGYTLVAANSTGDGTAMMGEKDRKPQWLRIADGGEGSLLAGDSQPNATFRVESPPGFAPMDIKALPWANLNRSEPEKPWLPLEPNLKLAALRTTPASVGILGSRFLPNERSPFIEWPLPILNPPGVKIWYPKPTDEERGDLPPGVHTDLGQAIAGLSGKGTILVRGNGLLEVPRSLLLNDPKASITIRAEEGSRPILALAVDERRKESALFRLEAGELAFEKVDFRARASGGAAAIVAMSGGKKCEFKSCSFLLAEDRRDAACIATMTDASASMKKEMPPRPILAFDSCFIRGAGRIVRCPAAAPMEVSLSNVAVATVGACFEIGPTAPGATAAGAIRVSMSRCTASLGSPLFDLGLAESIGDGKPRVGPAIEASVDSSIFAAWDGAGEPLIRVRGTIEAFESGATWSTTTGNLFVGYRTLLEAAGDDAIVEPTTWDRSDWRKWSKEKATAFPGYKFAKQPSAATAAKAKPADFEPSRDTIGFDDFGANLRLLPKPADETER